MSMSDGVSNDEVPIYPMRRTDPLAPPPELLELGRTDPVRQVELWNGSRPWLVTSYDLIREVLRDTRFSSSPAMPGFPMVTEARGALMEQTRSLVRVDPPVHKERRARVVREFSARRVSDLRETVEAIVDEQIDWLQAQARPADFVTEFAMPIPAQVISSMLGVPYEDHDLFLDAAIARAGSGTSTPAETVQADNVLRDYVVGLIEARKASPQDDLISRMIERFARDGKADAANDLVEDVVVLLTGGHESTAKMIALSLLVLCQHREQFESLQKDPSLIPNAVEELLRYLSITHITPVRAVTEDVVLGGQLIRQGEGVLIPVSAANWDDSIYNEADRFDIRREFPAPSLAFGAGPHQCIGQRLALLELESVVTALAARMPDIELVDDLDQLTFTDQAAFYGVEGLKVTW